MNDSEEISARKRSLRLEMRAMLKSVSDRERRSAIICSLLLETPAFRNAETVLCYVEFGNEVITEPIRDSLLDDPTKTMVVPWCEGEELRLFRTESMDELAPGAFGIREPKSELRTDPERKIEPEQIDLAIIGGLAFDRTGGRLGRGKGYFDRLIPRFCTGTPVFATAYDFQIIGQVPCDRYDRPVDVIVSESGIIQ